MCPVLALGLVVASRQGWSRSSGSAGEPHDVPDGASAEILYRDAPEGFTCPRGHPRFRKLHDPKERRPSRPPPANSYDRWPATSPVLGVQASRRRARSRGSAVLNRAILEHGSRVFSPAM